MSDYITAPTSGAEIVLATVPRRGDPFRDTLAALSDPNNYVHRLDARAWGDDDA
jgi:hypothetical protein